MKIMPTIISRIFEPAVVLSALTLVAIARSGLAGYAYYRFIAMFFLLMVLPPLILLSWAVKTKKVSNWDLGDRRERVKVLRIYFLFQVLNFLLTRMFGNAVLFQFFLFCTAWFIGFFLITIFWKISCHSGIATLGVLLITRWFGWEWIPFALAIPLVGWARVVRKDHSVGQVIGGVVYSILFLFIARVI